MHIVALRRQTAVQSGLRAEVTSQCQNTIAEIDPDHFRTVLGHYPTGVCVVTGRNEDGMAAGLVVGSFTSVSLDPPLVAFFPDKKSRSWPKVRDCGHFCVNVLAEDQYDLCEGFASKCGDKFAGVAHRISERGMPVLDDVLAYIECTIEDEIDTGDHTIVLGRVEELQTERDAAPLLFFKGAFGKFSAAG
ncbi:flavin reductase family protein [Parasphingopyxis algicola]|uniref:flavin reductase family protein n=1 Tax=Parasphingopyxis algicola TaxID=2026624 RepID=UPI0015A3D90C|nr:flavin reductase family protein [Parasphingopyxis algicola]QLC26362.1 flavin reductase family protein [Parasphingopyxis algicola]